MANVVCRSFETYIGFRVEKKDAARDLGFACCAAVTARAMPTCDT